VAGESGELRLAVRRDEDVRRAPANAVRVAVSRGDIDGGSDNFGTRGWTPPAACRRAAPGSVRRRSGGVGSVLLSPPVEEVLTHVEDERGDEHDRDHPTSHQDEHPAPLVASAISD
jgi:hypothetical protein